MNYIDDTKTMSRFFIDFFKTIFYFAYQFVYGVYMVLDNVLFKYIPIIIYEFKLNMVEFMSIMNALFYIFAYESSNILSNMFLMLGKVCFNLSDQFDRLARYLFPKSFGRG